MVYVGIEGRMLVQVTKSRVGGMDGIRPPNPKLSVFGKVNKSQTRGILGGVKKGTYMIDYRHCAWHAAQ